MARVTLLRLVLFVALVAAWWFVVVRLLGFTSWYGMLLLGVLALNTFWGKRDDRTRESAVNSSDRLERQVLSGVRAVQSGWPAEVAEGWRVPVARWVRGEVGVVTVVTGRGGGARDVAVTVCLRDGTGWAVVGTRDLGGLTAPGARAGTGPIEGTSVRGEFVVRDGAPLVVHSLVGFARADVSRFRVDHADRSSEHAPVDPGSGFFVVTWVEPGLVAVTGLSGDERLLSDLPDEL